MKRMAILFLLLPMTANAALITLEFNDATEGYGLSDPYIEDGFRIEVLNCHYDIVSSTAFANPIDGTTWMGFDRSGCLTTGGAAHLRLDAFGAFFDLLSIDVVRLGWTSLVSSNGGAILGCAGSAIPNCTGTLSLSGSEWTGVTYIDFFSSDDPGTPVGFDNIVLAKIPEPGTFALSGIGLFVMGLMRRRKA